MKTIIMMAAYIVLSTTIGQSQIKNAVIETVRINGNCSMCETAIEKAAFKKNVSKADWSKDSKLATITYDNKKTNSESVLKQIALAGYDNQSFLAPDAAYNQLPDCCKYERDQKHSTINTKASVSKSPTDSVHHHQTHDKTDQPMQESNSLNSVFNQYFLVKDALVSSDGNLASAKAKELLNAINAVKMDKLSADAHKEWMKVLDPLRQDAEHINGTKDLSHQRDHFMSLSKNIYILAKASKPAETIYYQFCPMANDGKGANWLSKAKEIKNPYYGSKMLSCGKNVEIID